MGFEVGQRVRCIKADPWCNVRGTVCRGPTYGDVLTIIEIERVDRFPGLAPQAFLAFAQLTRAGVRELFCAVHFRPLEDAEIERLRASCVEPGGGRRVREIFAA